MGRCELYARYADLIVDSREGAETAVCAFLQFSTINFYGNHEKIHLQSKVGFCIITPMDFGGGRTMLMNSLNKKCASSAVLICSAERLFVSIFSL